MLTNMSLWAMAAATTDLPFPTVFVLGFGTVFVGLLALILIITLLGKILGRSTAKKAEQAAKAMPANRLRSRERIHRIESIRFIKVPPCEKWKYLRAISNIPYWRKIASNFL